MIYFISDVHLGHTQRDANRQLENMLLALLDKIEADCETLFIVGDLFDYWFEYKTVIPKIYTRTLAALLRYREKGIPIEYVMGNHDFGHIDYFERELDIHIHKGDIVRTLGAKKFYISHGDGKAEKDKGYRMLKKVLRNPLSMKLFQMIHPDCGIGLASDSSKKSRGYTDKKKQITIEGLREFAGKKIAEGYDYLVMGHSHFEEITDFGRGIYVNIGSFTKIPTFGIFDGKEMQVLNVREFLEE